MNWFLLTTIISTVLLFTLINFYFLSTKITKKNFKLMNKSNKLNYKF
nr:ATP synthase F0 subunit 8 [Rhipicephalus maculatus]